MEQGTGPWLAGLIRTHIDSLAATLGDAAHHSIPVYQAMDQEFVRERFAYFYAAMADTLAGGEMAPLRAYLERVASNRMRHGVAAASFIQLAPITEHSLGVIIEAAATGDAGRVADGMRLVQSMINNTRLILSEINLRLLKESPNT
jgi:hypothetical protein